MAPTKNDGQTLPTKESSLYKSILKFYELKQYKKGLKAADQVLAKFPNHGETNALKGLTLNSMKQKEEAYEYVKKGLALNMKSHVCWHVYGLLYRSDRNYKEAIKCYRNALKCDPENAQIMKDLSWLQLQSRDLKAFLETRRQMVVERANNRVNWISFSIANYMNDDHATALSVLDSYEKTLDQYRPRPSYEESEMILYKETVLEAHGKLEDALQLLDDRDDDILDVVSWRERRALLLLRLGRFEEAKQMYLDMLKLNPENYLYHRGLQCAIIESVEWMEKLSGCDLPITEAIVSAEHRATLVELYDQFQQENPKVWSNQRIKLDVSSGEDFKVCVSEFLAKYLRKGVPSLFSSLKTMYATASVDAGKFPQAAPSKAAQEAARAKVNVIGEVVASFVSNLKNNGGRLTSKPDDEVEAPNVLLWALLFLARHQDYTGDQESALATISEAIEHTPTMVDLYQTKAKILKHQGDYAEATKVVDHGRSLDLADRYINSKCTKYLLSAGEIKKAETTIAMFTRHEGDSQANLFEMQAMWYEVASGRACQRAGNMPKALKYFLAVQKHFDDFEEDQFDFHGYCLRKMTISAYLAILKLEDNIRTHPFFIDAAHGAIMCLINVHDHKDKYVEKKHGGEDFSGMSAAERKKAIMKAKKLAAKKAKAAQALAEEEKKKEEALQGAEEKKDKRKGLRDVPPDPDPEGTDAFKKLVENPLDKAHELADLLLKGASSTKVVTKRTAQIFLDVFDVEVRRKKYMQAYKAIAKACEVLGADAPQVAIRLAPFVQMMATKKITFAPWAGVESAEPVDVALDLDDKIVAMVLLKCNELLGSSDPVKVATDRLSGESGFKKAAAGLALLMMNAGDRTSALAAASSVDEGCSHSELVAMDLALKLFNVPESVHVAFAQACKKLYPKSSVFA